MQSKFFTAEKIFDNVTRIGGLAGELCYLVEGSEKALLIDGLTGVGSLKAFVRELTDLPVTLVLTHGHVDHIGAAFEYGECWLHPDDIALLYEHGDAEARLGFASGGGRKIDPADVVPPRAIRTLPVQDGHVFDLGGVQLEVIHVPGHTYGSIVLLDRARRIVYSGDACNANTLLFLPGSTTIQEYKEALLHFKTFQPAFDGMFGGHGPGPVPNTLVDEALQLCDEIMAGTDDQEPGGFIGRECLYARKKNEFFQRADGGIANIAYSKDRIWKAQ